MSKKTKKIEESESDLILEFLNESGGSLCKADFGPQWHYGVDVEGREGQTRFNANVGNTIQEAVKGHYLFRQFMMRKRGDNRDLLSVTFKELKEIQKEKL